MIRSLILVAFIVGCGPDEATSEPAPPQAVPEEAAEADEAAEPSRAEPAEADNRAESWRLLRQGRAAARRGDLEEARGHFDALLRVAPSAPRFWCEAGFVSLRAERFDEARRRLDYGLALFGPVHRIGEALREPLAMCLYNRGRVEEDSGNEPHAVDYYGQSLELRDNATVRQHLEATLTSHLSADVESTTHAGVEVDANGFFGTNDVDELRAALRHALRGYREFDGAPAEAANAEVAASVAVPGGQAHVFRFDDAGSPASTVAVIVGLPRDGGYELMRTDVGLVDDDGDRSDIRIEDVEATVVHGILRVDFRALMSGYFVDMFEEGDVECVVEGYFPLFTEERTILCTTDGTHQCVSLVRSAAAEANQRMEADCMNGDGAPVPTPSSYVLPAAADVPSYSMNIALAPEGQITMTRRGGAIPQRNQEWLDRSVSLREWRAEGPHESIHLAVPH